MERKSSVTKVLTIVLFYAAICFSSPFSGAADGSTLLDTDRPHASPEEAEKAKEDLRSVWTAREGKKRAVRSLLGAAGGGRGGRTGTAAEGNAAILFPQVWQAMVDAGRHPGRYNLSAGCSAALAEYAGGLERQEPWAVRSEYIRAHRHDGLVVKASAS